MIHCNFREEIKIEKPLISETSKANLDNRQWFKREVTAKSNVQIHTYVQHWISTSFMINLIFKPFWNYMYLYLNVYINILYDFYKYHKSFTKYSWYCHIEVVMILS